MLYAEPSLKKAIGLYAERLQQLGVIPKVNRSEALRRALISHFLTDPVAKECLKEAGVRLPTRSIAPKRCKQLLKRKLRDRERAGLPVPEVITTCHHNKLRFECEPCSARDKAKAERDSRNTIQA